MEMRHYTQVCYLIKINNIIISFLKEKNINLSQVSKFSFLLMAL
jgi:hypothetical protein